MGLAQKLYNASPVPVQNLMTSAYGWRRQRQRYGPIFRRRVDELMESQWWTAEQFAEYQLRRLRELVAHAKAHVPYYRELYAGVDPAALADIRQLPTINKDVFRTQLDRLLADGYAKGNLIETHTSGSTGTPLTYFMHPDDFQDQMALLERQRRWAGVREGDRTITFTGRLIIPAGQKQPPYWRYNYFGKQLLASAYHLAPRNMPAYVAAFRRFRPIVIEGYPSASYLLARWVEEHGKPAELAPRAILATAEALHDYQRETIERVLGAPVFNYYGSSEGAPMITQCEKGGMHINPESGIFELLRPDGNPAAPGEPAEMVVTRFATRAVPLIRYRIRDAAIPEAPGACACGRQMPRVQAIIGRLDDMVYTPDRGWIGRLSQAVKVFPGSIREAQIVQENINTIVVNLVPEPGKFHESQLPPLLSDLRSRLGDVVKIEVRYLDSIPKGANSKFKYVVCKLSEDEKARLGMRQ